VCLGQECNKNLIKEKKNYDIKKSQYIRNVKKIKQQIKNSIKFKEMEAKMLKEKEIRQKVIYFELIFCKGRK